MKKGEVLLTVFAVFLGILTATQIQTPSGDKLYVSAKALADVKLALVSEEESIKRTELQIEDAKKRLEEFQTLAKEDEMEKLFENAKEELDYYKMVSGQTAVRGSGVTVIIADATRELYAGEDINNILVHDADLLTILNDLFTAGAEAVSLNGHRVIDTSSITCSGYTVRINDIFTATPFVIRAIGESGRLYSAMSAPGSYGELLKESVDFQVKMEDEIDIPAYPNYPAHEYLTITKEGETN